jgi:hypothetical protein
MLSSHAPGQYGFSGLFIKKCWPIIENDFLRMINDFGNQSIDLSNLNSSHITLIPKRSNLDAVDDYRPISFLIMLSTVSELVSTRLQAVII